MSTRVLVPLAEGFEEIEAIVPIDCFRRAGFEVVAAGLKEGTVKASRGTVHVPDCLLDAVLGGDFDLVYLPGGQPGANNLTAHDPLIEKLQKQSAEGKWVSAICAAPLALDKAGLLAGKNFVCHPGASKGIASGTRHEIPVVVDGKLITGRSAGAAMELALTVIREIAGPEKVREVNEGLIADGELVRRITET